MNIIRVAHNKNTGVYTVTYDNGKTKTFNKITKSIQEFYRQKVLIRKISVSARYITAISA